MDCFNDMLPLVTITLSLFIFSFNGQLNASEWSSFCGACPAQSEIDLPHIPEKVNDSNDLEYCQEILATALPGRREQLKRYEQRVFLDGLTTAKKLLHDSRRVDSACHGANRDEQLCQESKKQLAATIERLGQITQELVCLKSNLPRIEAAEEKVRVLMKRSSAEKTK